MSPIVTFTIPIIQYDFIEKCLISLEEYMSLPYRVIVIDQTNERITPEILDGGVNLWIRPYRNLGFSKAVNMGFVLSQTPYVCCLNDDVEFINDTWWQGIMDTFAMDERIVAVNPNSPKEGAWGYGLTQENKETWKPREGFEFDGNRSVTPVINKISINTPESAKTHYQDLLNNHPIWKKGTLCDALACWCTIFKRDKLMEIGLFDEKFYPGGGEDYDMMARIYSKDLRAVGTTKSWVWHHWGMSKDDMSGKDPHNKLFESRERWNDLTEIWGDRFDVWGHYNTPEGVRTPLERKRPIFIDEL